MIQRTRELNHFVYINEAMIYCTKLYISRQSIIQYYVPNIQTKNVLVKRKVWADMKYLATHKA